MAVWAFKLASVLARGRLCVRVDGLDPRTGLMRDVAHRHGSVGSSRAATSGSATRADLDPVTSPPRVVIEGVTPELDGGRFPVKRVVGETVTVGADVFSEGHDRLAAMLRFRRAGEDAWQEAPMEPRVNDRWEATFTVTHLGTYEYVVHAWVDEFASWRSALANKCDAGLDVTSERLAGAGLLGRAAQ